jgi:hypothetical protein
MVEKGEMKINSASSKARILPLFAAVKWTGLVYRTVILNVAGRSEESS